MIEARTTSDADHARLLRRIRALAERRSPAAPAEDPETSRAVVDRRRRRSGLLAARLAAAVEGELVDSPGGRVIRIDRPPGTLRVDRERLAGLPGQPAPDVPLVCLDTETTGLGTATGTLAFLVGLGWWVDDAFHQCQLLLPDHADEHALLAALRDALPSDCWLVTYNGRGFDWPLLVTRFRLERGHPPGLGGHLDLLPLVRALFRHRLSDARLRTVESELLGLRRSGDVDGWEIPGRYLGFLRDGEPSLLADVVRHNHEDVRSLARLLAHLADGLAVPERRPAAHPGDLAGLARLLARADRADEALECLELAVARPAFRAEPSRDHDERGLLGARASRVRQVPWWSPRAVADIGGPVNARREPASTPDRLDSAWTAERIERERAHLLRRVGRVDEAVSAWRSIALRGGRIGALAWVEVAKIEEHVRRDPRAALDATDRGVTAATRLRAIGLPVRGLDRDLTRRRRRLADRIARASRRPTMKRRPGPAIRVLASAP
ncbi:MAG TPA: ribonuclease H-like domain-containing protein [Candidatus Limnocylindrales bacterium]|nr:ribonuclease H-like domain-containing protein [Candidatus Limnocylindrales bacterium]